jgi:pullulanase
LVKLKPQQNEGPALATISRRQAKSSRDLRLSNFTRTITREQEPHPRFAASDLKGSTMKFWNSIVRKSIIGAVLATIGCSGGTTSSSNSQPPTQPTALAAASITASSLVLSWTASTASAGISGYNVLRNGTKVGTAASTSYTDTGLSAATSYSYTVSANDSAGNTSTASASISVMTLALPTQPTNLSAGAVTSNNVTLTWSASVAAQGVAGYNIFRNGIKVGTSATLTFTDTGLTGSTSYSYTVSAYDSAGDTSPLSAALMVTTLVQPPPTQPTTLVASSITSTSVTLSWTASTSSAGVAGYNVFRNAVKEGTSATTNYTDTGLTASTAYSYTVSAYDAAGNTSALSAPLSVTTLSETPPASPTEFSAVENAPYCNVILSWNAAIQGSFGIASYQILRNGSVLGSTANLSYNDTTAAANTTYDYAVETEDASGNLSTATASVAVSTGSCTTAQSFHLGAMYSASQSIYSLWSPTSSSVQLDLNGTLYPMTLMASSPNGYTDVYSVTVPGNQNLVPYNFQVGGVTARDPYGVMVQPGTNNDITMDPSQVTLPAGWTPTPTFVNRVDSIVYETDVREFTNDPSSGIPTADRGYFEGMTDSGGTVNGAAGAPSTGIDHLVDMGVTHIQIMPFFDYNDCISSTAENTCFNWGYDPLNYNIPTANYSQTPTNYTNRVLELKQMIDNFHKKGIRVIMDVVYNHTTNETVLGNITSDYYLATDITGEGNTLDGSNPMVARMIQDSLEYWVTQYNVDGFRFDLLGVFPLATVNQWGTYLTTLYPNRNLLLYGEPWVGIGNPASTAFNLADIGTIPSAHVGAFNGAYRTALKGSDDDAGGDTGFIFNQSTSDSYFGSYIGNQTWPDSTNPGYGPISLGVEGSPVPVLPATINSNVFPGPFSSAPEQAINYISVHDNLNLYDKVTLWEAANNASSQTLTNSLISYGFSTILTAQGLSFMYEGDEFQHSKDFNSNSYNTEYDLVWSNLQSNTNDAATYATVKGLIALRKAHPSLRLSTWSEIDTNVKSDQESASLVVTTINASAAANETWKQALIIYNSSTSAQTVTLPSGNWNIEVQNSQVVTGTPTVVTGAVSAAASAMTLLYQ